MNINNDEKLLVDRAEDAVRLCEKQYSVRFVGFLTPREAEIIRHNVYLKGVRHKFFGGYDDAERTIFVAIPEYVEEEELFELVSLLEISGRDIVGLSHRDYLGSLLGLGLKREKIGDILVFEERCLVFVLRDIADYILLNLEKIGRCGVKVREISPGEAQIPPRRTEKICGTVAALRLDCITAAALKTSRSKALEYIESGRVHVNWEEQDSPSFFLKPGDVFSIRGAGKFRLAEDTSETKKGRISICIEKMV